MEKEYEIIKFEDGDFSLDVNVLKEDNSVWLNRKQLSILYDKDIKTIGKHVNKILENYSVVAPVVANFATVVSNGKTYNVEYYNLDIILEIGNRIKSKRTNLFKEWAENLLNKQNEKISLVEPIIKFEYENVSLDVTVSPREETVWLTQAQIAELFDTTQPNISMHINNIYTENELEEGSTYKDFLYVQTEGTREITRSIKAYNLDMIISIGYRVNSKRGIMFRKWATNVLKQYLLNGSAINADRIIAFQANILNLEANVINIENRLKNLEMTIYADNAQIIFEGEILEPYTFIRKLFFLAREELTIIDPYADKFLISMLLDLKVRIEIITKSDSYLNKEILPSNITIIKNDIIHDRFIIVDKNVYLIGTSINDIGKKRFFIMKADCMTKEKILA